MDFAFPADDRVKIENEKINKSLDLARELKTLWNIQVSMISIIVIGLGMVPISLEKRLEELEIRGSIQTTETSALIRSENYC